MANQPKGKPRPPHWPTLEEQLSAVKVKPGSALEKLIRSNQDFDLLYPEEAHDQLPYPPWLRVYWRKAHPKIDWYKTVAYPLILKEIGGWMRRHQDLPVQGDEKTTKHSPHLNEEGEGRR
jgi:hypothetical protein